MAVLSLPQQPRLLVICVARFGDTLLITPTLAALRQRWPQARLDVIAHPARMTVLQGLPEIDTVIGLSKNGAFWRGWLPGKRYDAALVYGGDAALYRYARRVARQVLAFAAKDGAIAGYIDVQVARPTGLMAAAQERALLLAPLGVEAGDWRLRYRVSDGEAQAAADYTAAQGWSGRRLVGLQLQSFPTKAYRDWPAAHFAELIRQLLARYDNLQFVLLGGPESRESAMRLASELGPRVASAAGTFDMRANAALIARLALYIGVDTGPTHLAGALGVPMVAMYHCAHPGRYLAPQQHPALTVIEHPAGSLDRGASMADIPVATVLTAACHWLDRE